MKWLFLITSNVKECQNRGINVEKNLAAVTTMYENFLVGKEYVQPIWWADDVLKSRVLTTHRARLFEKSAVLYAQYEQYQPRKTAQVCCEHCNYFWPSHYFKRSDFTGITYVNQETIKRNAQLRAATA